MFKTFKYIFIPALALAFTMMIHNWMKTSGLLPNVPQATSENKGEVLIGGDFSLVNQDGETVKNTDFLGKYMLVYFGFTNCPMICPTDMADITQALNQLDDDLVEKVQPIFITVDPERDTSEHLKTYLENFHSKFQALTGTKEQTKAAESAYRVYSRKSEDEEVQGYNMDHSAYIYLMGTDGKYITHFRHDQGADEIAQGLIKHIDN
jgi:cytochrome oxidase Cu insertion factor (SCO1/SenC/PrrC family)